MNRPFCAAADWGTSSFRLWLFDADGNVVAERRSDEGLTIAAGRGFEAILEAHLAILDAPAALPVVVCGMAGSRQGWVEAGYLDTPASLGDVLAGAVLAPGARREVRILPGLAQRDPERPDVIRGEETQLLGCVGKGRRLACLPGTHSKWAAIDGGTVTGFTSFMTGEIFAVLAEHSILRHSLGNDRTVDPRSEAFRHAVRSAFEAPGRLTASLFAIRAGGLLSLRDDRDAAATLSGLLVGAEIAGAAGVHDMSGGVALIASGRLEALYAGALAACGIAHERFDADEAVRNGLFAAARRFWPPPEGATQP